MPLLAVTPGHPQALMTGWTAARDGSTRSLSSSIPSEARSIRASGLRNSV